ncbi:hypothetical protein ACCO45_012587 [Purpureocillium lilacinum]|uniref:Uncharacterized protein n=1 Tax=Purpureocillium lilacinum TaxID=33203 RepID=A0ACC4D9Z6_PURLI
MGAGAAPSRDEPNGFIRDVSGASLPPRKTSSSVPFVHATLAVRPRRRGTWARPGTAATISTPSPRHAARAAGPQRALPKLGPPSSYFRLRGRRVLDPQSQPTQPARRKVSRAAMGEEIDYYRAVADDLTGRNIRDRLVAQVNCSSVEGPEARRDTPNMSSLSRSTSRSAPMEQADLMRPGYYLFSRLGKLVIDMEQAGNVPIFVLRGYAHSRACTSRAAIRWSSPNGQVQRPAALCSIADWLCRTPERHVARTSPIGRRFGQHGEAIVESASTTGSSAQWYTGHQRLCSSKVAAKGLGQIANNIY